MLAVFEGWKKYINLGSFISKKSWHLRIQLPSIQTPKEFKNRPINASNSILVLFFSPLWEPYRWRGKNLIVPSQMNLQHTWVCKTSSLSFEWMWWRWSVHSKEGSSFKESCLTMRMPRLGLVLLWGTATAMEVIGAPSNEVINCCVPPFAYFDCTGWVLIVVWVRLLQVV